MSTTETGAVPVTLDKIHAELYKEIRETDNVSFRLLGLVPLVSGTALIALILRPEGLHPVLVTLLGLFAAAITLGLFRWELCNVRTCVWLINYAQDIERASLAAGGMTNLYRNRPDPPQCIGKPEAEKLIYGATILTWLALAPIVDAVSLSWTPGPLIYALAAVVITAATVASFFADLRGPSVPGRA